MEVGYDCTKCGLKIRDVQVRERQIVNGKLEDPENYVHYVARMCGENHSIRSPLCSARQLDIYIPVTDDGIGFGRLPEERVKKGGTD